MTSFAAYRESWIGNPRADLLSGLVVALALIPEAIAFSIIAGVDPKVGLYASFSIALLTAITGGRPGMISAATAATAVLMVTLGRDHGLEYLLAATVLAGVLQVLAGAARLGRLMTFVSRSTGFGAGVFVPEGAAAPRDKDGKVAFLEAVFGATAAALGEAAPARPLKVVAGLEAEQTNEFLLQLGRAARMGPGHPAVQAAMAGVSAGSATSGGTPPTEPPPAAAPAAPEATARERQTHREEEPARAAPAHAPASEPEPELKPRRMQRPQSARKAPPKPRAAEGEAVMVAPARGPVASRERQRPGSPEPPTAALGGIVSDTGAGLIDDDDESLEEEVEVVVEAATGGAAFGELPSQGGKLVQDILDEKQRLDAGPAAGGSGDAAPAAPSTDGGIKLRRRASMTMPTSADEVRSARPKVVQAGDIEKVRADIQSLCQSTNPLGKTVDLLQEDIDAMEKEYASWMRERKTYTVKLQKQSRVPGGDSSMAERLTDAEGQLSKMRGKIAATKMDVENNDRRIARLLALLVDGMN